MNKTKHATERCQPRRMNSIVGVIPPFLLLLAPMMLTLALRGRTVGLIRDLGMVSKTLATGRTPLESHDAPHEKYVWSTRKKRLGTVGLRYFK